MAAMTELAHAKLNLTLDVLGRREDGYHELRMVMQSVALSDLVTIRTGEEEGIRVRSNLEFLPAGPENLAAKAAVRLCETVGADWNGLEIALDKHIPVCAGMAGGSSDAAAVLRALNEGLSLGLSREALARVGEKVGSDVPYCVMGGTMLAEGRGERLRALPALPLCHAVVCKPSFSISTPEFFRRIDGVRILHRPDTRGMLRALEAGDLAGVARRMYNVFEDVLPRPQAAAVDGIRQTLIAHGALGACMSGTGPTVFGLFDALPAALSARDALRAAYAETYITVTL